MRVRTFLRQIRGGRSLGDASAVTGLARGDLSRIELGHLLPDDRNVPALEAFYGPRVNWYPAGVARVTHADPARCAGCDQPIDPAELPNRRYHGPDCRAEARRRARLAGV